MKPLMKELGTSVLATIALGFLLCGVYPIAVWGAAQLFPARARGSLIENQGKLLGSELIGQGFSGEKYFHPRPSAAGNGYDAANSGGTNLGPLSQKLVDSVKERVAAYRRENGLEADAPVPADAVLSSASGLDPHISVKNAGLQSRRVAAARGMREETLKHFVAQHTEGRDLGILGEPRVNVLLLNLALDRYPGGPEKGSEGK
jgi:K+-transporting ATPase ATPase C chain